MLALHSSPRAPLRPHANLPRHVPSNSSCSNMTTDTILSLIDQRLSKAHLDGNGQAAMALNELRERIVAENVDKNDAETWRHCLALIRDNGFESVGQMLVRIKELQAEVSSAWRQAAQLCAVRKAAGMQVGTVEELCQRIEKMRSDADTWHKIAIEEMTR